MIDTKNLAALAGKQLGGAAPNAMARAFAKAAETPIATLTAKHQPTQANRQQKGKK